MPTSFVPLFPGLPGGPEMIVILLIVVLLFGANKLPKLARSSGQAMGEFKKGREEIEDELSDMRDDTVGDTDSSFEQNQQSQGQNQPQHSQTQDQPQNTQNQGQEQRSQSGQRSQGGQRSQNQRSGQSSANEWGSPATNRERDRR